ncbi:MAG: D-alanyl-D-alanine carboxypeptidase family protein [Acutalibacteraceae bacterium]|nr:D-alanyl-D-alanine carboxypeptidase family protein [Acutalibacteraceae bacterium]
MKRITCLAVCLFLILFSVRTKALTVSAKAATLMDGVSGKVLFSKNQDMRLSMASTTKIMTALLLCESGKLDDTVTVTDQMVYVEGTSMGLKTGMKVTGRDLLYGMLLSSGNDAATAAAILVGSNVKGFVAMMNEKATALGLENTNFDTPSGLDGETHYTTSYELALLARYALSNADFKEACKTKKITLKIDGKNITLVNHNKLLSLYEGAVGVKTGFTKKSGRCLVSAAEKDGGLLIAVTLNDGNDWQDHIDMLNFGFSCIGVNEATFSEVTYTVPVFSGNKEYATAKSQEIAFRTANGEKVIKKEYIYPYLFAPVKEGERIGYIEYISGGLVVAKDELYALENIEEKSQANFGEKLIAAFLKLLCYI